MATGDGLALPEHLQDEDACSWLKRFEVFELPIAGTTQIAAPSDTSQRSFIGYF